MEETVARNKFVLRPKKLVFVFLMLNWKKMVNESTSSNRAIDSDDDKVDCGAVNIHVQPKIMLLNHTISKDVYRWLGKKMDLLHIKENKAGEEEKKKITGRLTFVNLQWHR